MIEDFGDPETERVWHGEFSRRLPHDIQAIAPSIRINDQWRICFKWQNGNSTDVEIVDYH